MHASAVCSPHAPVASRPARAALLLFPPAVFLLHALFANVRRFHVTTVSTRVPQLAAVHALRDTTSVARRIRSACRVCSPRPNLRIAQLRSYGPAYSSIIVSHALKLVYVPVFKAATTATMWQIAYLEPNHHVLNATGHDLDVALHDMAHPAWREHAIYRWPDHHIHQILHSPSYLKFGFVRNPYHRLISAYVDKIQRPAVHSPEYQGQMYSLFGDDVALRTAANLTKPTFEQFVTTVSAVLSQPRVQTARQPHSFEDNRSRRDLHWRPQVELLHPDLIPFDFIGSFDNLQHDRRVLLEWMYQHTSRRIPHRLLAKRHATDPAQKAHLYHAIHHNHSLRQLIIHTYKQDFETFNFSILPPSM